MTASTGHWIAFLRAINLGRSRRFPMADVKACLTEAGFAEVETHLATGNVRLRSRLRSRVRLEERLEELFEARTGFAVPTITVTPAELRTVSEAAVALELTAARRYATFLKQPLSAEAAAGIDAWDAPGEGAKALGRAVLWWIDHPSASARLSNARIERNGIVATTRDLKVVTTLARRWCAEEGHARSRT